MILFTADAPSSIVFDGLKNEWNISLPYASTIPSSITSGALIPVVSVSRNTVFSDTNSEFIISENGVSEYGVLHILFQTKYSLSDKIFL